MSDNIYTNFLQSIKEVPMGYQYIWEELFAELSAEHECYSDDYNWSDYDGGWREAIEFVLNLMQEKLENFC